MRADAQTIVTVPVAAAAPTGADRKLANAAASLVVAAKNSDERGVTLILEAMAPWQRTRIFMLLGAVADRDAVLQAAGFAEPGYLQDCYNRYEAMRRAGVAQSEIPAYITEGWRMRRRIRRREVRAAQVKAA